MEKIPVESPKEESPEEERTVNPTFEMVDDEGQPLSLTNEWGVNGAKVYSGYVHEEFLKVLQGQQGQRIYREMRDNDSTVGAILFAVEMLLRAVPWSVEYDSEEDEDISRGHTPYKTEGAPAIKITDAASAVAFVESILDDMDHTWEDFIANVVTMLTFGWQLTEIVYKRRLGPAETDKRFKSKYSDGLIGVRKLGNRAQETLDRWEITKNGEVLGMYQTPPNAGPLRYIPMEKALLFRTTPNKDNPEGRSVLRNAYRPWYFLKNIQEIEAIAIERELNGLPVVYIPNSLMDSKDANKQATVAKYVKLVRDIKYNSQGGVVLPSDPFYDAEGKPTSLRQVELTLLNAGGSRAIDTDKTVKRYEGNIARTILADFIMLGQGDKGSFALSKSKTDLFLGALEGWNNAIAAILNRKLIPDLWEINGLDPNLMPYLKPGRVAPEDIEELGTFVEKLSRAGFVLAPDEETENRLRSAGGLPDKIPDELSDDMDTDIVIEEEEEEDLEPPE